ncbi:hypothetical protein CBM2634_B170188 [Cupriavidus taiwanensis]|uniref:histidine kinase n=2 Tax=Cupriavidus taiwanensis TaxID=164546 RepID=A0A375J8F1_9BURK|nr:hypothetical protein CBM2634_B170188 [Cupriavidus taiwanensis]
MFIHLAADMHDAVVAVSDRGCGFAGDAVLRLFDAFYTTRDEGMGMRLAICQCIVNGHGGGIPCGMPPRWRRTLCRAPAPPGSGGR